MPNEGVYIEEINNNGFRYTQSSDPGVLSYRDCSVNEGINITLTLFF